MDPSQKLLNLAKKTDLLALTEKYNLTNVKHAMRGFMCLAQRHDAVMPTRLKHATPSSRVKHSTTEPTMCILEEQYGKTNEMWRMLPGVVVNKGKWENMLRHYAVVSFI